MAENETALQPLVAILMGSTSDMDEMTRASKILEELGIAHEVVVTSAHRSPEQTAEYAQSAQRPRHQGADRRRGSGRASGRRRGGAHDVAGARRAARVRVAERHGRAAVHGADARRRAGRNAGDRRRRARRTRRCSPRRSSRCRMRVSRARWSSASPRWPATFPASSKVVRALKTLREADCRRRSRSARRRSRRVPDGDGLRPRRRCALGARGLGRLLSSKAGRGQKGSRFWSRDLECGAQLLAAEPPAEARALAAAFWPGRSTIVLPGGIRLVTALVARPAVWGCGARAIRPRARCLQRSARRSRRRPRTQRDQPRRIASSRPNRTSERVSLLRRRRRAQCDDRIHRG